MATKLQMMASRRGIVKTTNSPSARAIVGQWTRYFELKGEDADEAKYAEEFKRAFGVRLERGPIADPEVAAARKYVVTEYFRNLSNGNQEVSTTLRGISAFRICKDGSVDEKCSALIRMY